jgi:hypothetical protein
MPFFRFTQSSDLEEVMGGRIHVTHERLHKFLEFTNGDQWFYDRNTLEQYEQVSANTGNYILSLSAGTLDELQSLIHSTHYHYDSCIEILSPEALMHHLYQHGRINGEPLKNIFNISCDYVQYTTEATIPDAIPVTHAPFIKSAVHQHEREYRFVFHPLDNALSKVELGKDYLFIDFPHAINFLRTAFSNVDTHSYRSNIDTRTHKELLSIIMNKFNMISNRPRVSIEEMQQLSDENYHKKTLIYDAQFSAYFYNTHFNTLMSTYWLLRARGHRSAVMDSLLDNKKTLLQLNNMLGEYLFGSEFQPKKSVRSIKTTTPSTAQDIIKTKRG